MLMPVTIGELTKDARASAAAHSIAQMIHAAVGHGFAPPFADLQKWTAIWQEEAKRVASFGPDPDTPGPALVDPNLRPG